MNQNSKQLNFFFGILIQPAQFQRLLSETRVWSSWSSPWGVRRGSGGWCGPIYQSRWDHKRGSTSRPPGVHWSTSATSSQLCSKMQVTSSESILINWGVWVYQSNCKAIGVCDMLGNPGGHVIRPNKHCYINGYTVDRTLAYKNLTFVMSEIRKDFKTLGTTSKKIKSF